jgi:hypothetical protein
MKDLFEQWTKMTEKMWDPWKQMMDVPGMLKPEQFLSGKWSSWLGAMRSSFDVNAAWWSTFMDQLEEVFFKTFKESQLHTRSLEDQLRSMWDVIRKTQKTQVETVKEQIERMERLLRDQEEATQKP